MTWPTDDLTKVSLDQASDDPSAARAELEALLDKVKLMLAEPVAIKHESNTFTQGQVVGTPTGGDKGVGSVNAQTLYIQGSSVLADKFVVRAYRSTNVSIATGSAVTIPFNVEDSDADAVYNLSTNKYIPGVVGVYFITAKIQIVGTTAGKKYTLDLSSDAGSAGNFVHYVSSYEATLGSITIQTSALISLNATQYVAPTIRHDNAGAVNLNGGSINVSYFNAFRVL